MKKIFLILGLVSNLSFAGQVVEHDSKELKCDIFIIQDTVLPLQTVTGQYYADVVKKGKVESTGEFDIEHVTVLGGLLQVRFRNNGESMINYRPRKDEGRWLSARSEGGILSTLNLDVDLNEYHGQDTNLSISCKVQDKQK